jgi:hypothetical protein
MNEVLLINEAHPTDHCLCNQLLCSYLIDARPVAVTPRSRFVCFKHVWIPKTPRTEIGIITLQTARNCSFPSLAFLGIFYTTVGYNYESSVWFLISLLCFNCSLVSGGRIL